MAKRVKQFRFYGEGNAENQPAEATIRSYTSGAVFQNYQPVLKLGIQTLPGTKFSLNNSDDPIIVGLTGIYELDLNNSTEISAINFDSTSMNLINSLGNAYLLVDIVYNKEGE